MAKRLPKSKLAKFANRLYDPAKVGLRESSEGVEELINTVSSIEGERAGRNWIRYWKDDNSSIVNRVVKYLGEEEAQDAFIWGMVGGILFKGMAKATGMDASKGINERKLADKIDKVN